MKIVLTGGGTGGHFYPLIAVAQEINAYVATHNLVQPDLFYLSNHPYDERALFEQGITYVHVSAGKMRTYASLKNGSDFFRTLIGLPRALKLMYSIWPDVVFSKGGYVSVPVVFAARILRIPVFVHDSDAVPGRANLWASKFAARIGISYPEASTYFKGKEKKVALVGNPVRREIRSVPQENAQREMGLDPALPTLLILGGSQGAESINTTILKGLKELLPTFQILHQTGPNNFDTVKEMSDLELGDDAVLKSRYHPVALYDVHTLAKAASAADLIVSRAGSGAIFEVASFEKPAILVPIPEDVSRDQRTNAYAYARTGAAVVIEQHNFTPHVLLSEVQRILSDATLLGRMREGAVAFKKPEAARLIAEEVLRIGLKHEV